MSDQMNAPLESWRPIRRARGGMDPDMARIGLIAAAVAGVLALAAGGYAMLGHRPHATPVIEADSRPLRVRPENPGGAMVAGAEEQAMGAAGHGQADAMAPPAEAPLPQALRAQIDAVRLAQAPAVSAAEPASPAPVMAAPSVPEPAPTASANLPPSASVTEPPPAIAPARPPAHATAVPAATPPASAGGTQVQLAALGSEEAARTEWQRLSHRMPELLGPRHPAVLRAERDGKSIWRLRTGGFADSASATAFCAQVRLKGAGCSIASF